MRAHDGMRVLVRYSKFSAGAFRTHEYFRCSIQTRCVIDNSDVKSGPTCTCAFLVRGSGHANVGLTVLPRDVM
jgi:hypothetical protein